MKNRKKFQEGIVAPDPDKDKSVNMFNARGQRWKRLRLITNPVFTAVKMKQMCSTVTDCTNILLKKFDEKAETGESFDLYQ